MQESDIDKELKTSHIRVYVNYDIHLLSSHATERKDRDFCFDLNCSHKFLGRKLRSVYLVLETLLSQKLWRHSSRSSMYTVLFMATAKDRIGSDGPIDP
jgi:hypothetical protein